MDGENQPMHEWSNSKGPTWTINFIGGVKFPIANVAEIPGGDSRGDLWAPAASAFGRLPRPSKSEIVSGKMLDVQERLR